MPDAPTLMRPGNERPILRRRVAGFLVIALALALAGISSSTPSSALGKIRCDVDGTPSVTVGNFDPIVNHNMAASAHEHQFFGNKDWLKLSNPNAANYPDLVDKATKCRVVQDTAGYWVPSLRYISGAKVGQLIAAQQFTAYYRPASGVGGPSAGPAQAIPADARLVAVNHYNWNCGQFGGVAPQKSIPSCIGQSGQPGHTLTAHIDFPSCWDGVAPNHKAADVGETRDNAHYAYYDKKASRCPAAFPVGVTQIRITIQYAYVGGGTDVALESDAPAGTTDGQSLHADFWNSWNQTFFVDWIKKCVNVTGPNSLCMP